MEVISGVLLTCVVFLIIGFLLYESICESAVFRKYAQVLPDNINDPLVGEIGQVIENKEGAELMKVRIRGERWNANLIDGHGLPTSTVVRVTAVNGLILNVEAQIEEHADLAKITDEETAS